MEKKKQNLNGLNGKMVNKLLHKKYLYDNSVLELRIDSGERNTFTKELLEEIIHSTRELTNRITSEEQDDCSLRLVLLTSSQGKYFSNGLDPSLFLDKSYSEIQESVELLMEASRSYFYLPLPTISIINGHCIAAGAVFAIFSDFRYMVTGSGRIGFPEVAIDLNFPSFPSHILTDLVGRKNTRDLLFSGKLLKPKEAMDIGLIDGIVTDNYMNDLDTKFQKLKQLSLPSTRGIKTALVDFYRFSGKDLIQEDVKHLTNAIASPLGQENFRKLSK